jgi:CheY-like chemotaxis protein
MAKILIVDDNATNRKLLVALLNHEGHATIEAVDGADGLAAARTERPQLVISDILMPTMDGYEFVRQLRADSQVGNTPVIFHTAHYHELAARQLAQSCRVARVLAKPSNSAEIREAVEQALANMPTPNTDAITDEFDREHLRLLTNKLSEHADELRAANARLAALTELNVQLASERDPRVLLEKVCQEARNLLGSKYAVLAVGEKEHSDTLIFSTSGIDFGGTPAERPRIDAGALGKVVAGRRSWRVSNSEGRPVDTGLPASYPPASAVLAVPLSSLTHTYGWLCLADKVGAEGFSAEDDRILSILGAQVGRIYENGKLFREVQHHSAQLLVEMDKREQAQAKIERISG